MVFNYQVVLKDPDNLGASIDAILVKDLQQALANWSQVISGLGTLVVNLNIAPSTNGVPTAGGNTGSGSFSHRENGYNVFDPGAKYELATGQHVPGSTSEIEVFWDPRYSQVFTYVDLTATGTQINPKQSPIEIFMHEVGHGLGFIGLQIGLKGRFRRRRRS